MNQYIIKSVFTQVALVNVRIGFLRVEGKKTVFGVRTDGFCTKTVTLRYLTCAALVKVRSVT